MSESCLQVYGWCPKGICRYLEMRGTYLECVQRCPEDVHRCLVVVWSFPKVSGGIRTVSPRCPEVPARCLYVYGRCLYMSGRCSEVSGVS
jgi:hypothetical protein